MIQHNICRWNSTATMHKIICRFKDGIWKAAVWHCLLLCTIHACKTEGIHSVSCFILHNREGSKILQNLPLIIIIIIIIIVNNQLDALSLMYLFISPLYIVSNSTVFIIRRSIVLTRHLVCTSLFRWLPGMTGIPGSHLHRLVHTRWRVNTIDLLMMNTVLFETL